MVLGKQYNVCINIQRTHELIVASMESLNATVFQSACKDPIGSILGDHTAEEDNNTTDCCLEGKGDHSQMLPPIPSDARKKQKPVLGSKSGQPATQESHGDSGSMRAIVMRCSASFEAHT